LVRTATVAQAAGIKVRYGAPYLTLMHASVTNVTVGCEKLEFVCGF